MITFCRFRHPSAYESTHILATTRFNLVAIMAYIPTYHSLDDFRHVVKTIYGPAVGANAEGPKRIVAPKIKIEFGRETSVPGMACIILWMREATYISDDFRMRLPLRPQTHSKLRFAFCYLLTFVFSLFWGALGTMVPWCHSGAIYLDSDSTGTR